MPDLIPYSQKSFSGGMDLFTERTRLPEDRYPLLVNARSRFGKLTPIKKCVKLTEGLPDASQTIYQGLYAAGSFALVFAGGRAYARDLSNLINPSFLPINNFQMSQAVDTIYLELVPASTINYPRALNTTDEPSSGTILMGNLIAPSPIAALVQDGINQPFVILSNGQARVTKNYNQWTNTADGREYVPIGKQMVFAGSKLYIASPDGSEIFHSVSGRPIDFMIIIDTNGDKLPLETEGGASNVSHRVFFDRISCLGKIPSNLEAFYVGAPKESATVSPDFTDTIYGEPRFSNQYIGQTGALNHVSFLGSVNGDSTFIDNFGIRSFNAILQEKNEGRNNPFSLLISPLFANNIQQQITAAGQFDNYSCYAIKTVYGNIVAWFDELRNVWDAIDIYSNVTGTIRQFADIVTPAGVRKLLCLTSDGGVYEMFGSTENERAGFYYGDNCTQDTKVQQTINNVNVVVSEAQSSGIIYATLFVDGKRQNTLPLEKNVTGTYVISSSIALPFGQATTNLINNVLFDFNRSSSGWRSGCFVEWDFQADITHISMIASPVTNTNTTQRQVIEFANAKTVLGIK